MRDAIAETTRVDYPALAQALETVAPKGRIAADPLRTLCYGTDASFYRLVPQIVVTVESEAEVIGALDICARAGASVTFRAAGTSLSGQSISSTADRHSDPTPNDDRRAFRAARDWAPSR